jgi:P-type E1-E2 ATPase
MEFGFPLPQILHRAKNSGALPLQEMRRRWYAGALSKTENLQGESMSRVEEQFGNLRREYQSRRRSGRTRPHVLRMAALVDPLRPEVPNAIRRCKAAGIRVIMITGDHRRTAAAVGREIGLIDRDR